MILGTRKHLRGATALCATALLATFSTASAEEDAVSAWISLDYNSHFMSSGADVWGAGDDPFETALFQPSAGIEFATGEGSGLYFGVWLDINHESTSQFGEPLQEVDLWTGYYFPVGDFTIDLTFQQWYYASETEGIFDVKVSYNASEYAPYVKVRSRFDVVGGQEEGVVIEAGASYSFSYENIDFSIPFTVAGMSSDYQGGDSGFGYAYTGLTYSMPIGIPDKYGAWDFHGGILAWYTDDDVIPGNPDDTFITLNAGIGLSF